MITRHKKPGGFRKLVVGLETTPPDRRRKILDAFKTEDPEFALHAEASVFTFEEFVAVPDGAMCELLDAFKGEERILALALFHADAALLKKFTLSMTKPMQAEFKEWTEGMLEVHENERTSARYKIITKARDLESHAKIKLKKLIGNYPD